MKILIIGVGSQAEVVQELCYDLQWTDVSFSSMGLTSSANLPERIKQNYLGDLDNLEQGVGGFHCLVGIGDNHLRKQMVEQLEAKFPNIRWLTVVHPRAYLARNVEVGEGTVICPGVSIQTRTTIGRHCLINTNASLDHHGIIEDYIHVAPNSTVCGNCILHQGSFVGATSTLVPKVVLRAWSFIRAGQLVKSSNCPIKIYEPYIKQYKTSVINAIEDGWISSQGRFVGLATELLSQKLQIPHVLLVSNGTCATHCLFLALKWKYPEIKRIYLPNNVYIAAWNPALNEYPMDCLELMDIDPETWNVPTDTDYWESLEPNSAVLVVHNVGNIVNVPRLKRIRPDLIFLEDNCEGLFGTYQESASGTSPSTLCSSISFFANKTITSGEGGAVLTHDTELYEYLSKKVNQGMSDQKYLHEMHAYNYRITNLQAAILYDQLLALDHILDLKKTIFDNYRKLLETSNSGEAGLRGYRIDPETVPANWIFALRIPGNPGYREVKQFMDERGVEIRPFFYPITSHRHMTALQERVKPKQLELSLQLHNEIIMIPSYPGLTYKEQEYIIESLYNFASNLNS